MNTYISSHKLIQIKFLCKNHNMNLFTLVHMDDHKVYDHGNLRDPHDHLENFPLLQFQHLDYILEIERLK